MRKSQILHLYDYNYWANARILDTASLVSPEVLVRPMGMSHGSMHGTLVHALAGEWIWRVRCQDGVSPRSLLSASDFPDLPSVRGRWAEEEGAMRAYLKALSDSGLENVMRYRSTLDNKEYVTPLWQVLLHLANHGTQHRSEVAAELTRAGRSPGNLDYIVYIRQPEPFTFDRTWITSGA